MSLPHPSAPSRPALRLVGAGVPVDLPDVDPSDFDGVFRRYSPYVARVALRCMKANSRSRQSHMSRWLSLW